MQLIARLQRIAEPPGVPGEENKQWTRCPEHEGPDPHSEATAAHPAVVEPVGDDAQEQSTGEHGVDPEQDPTSDHTAPLSRSSSGCGKTTSACSMWPEIPSRSAHGRLPWHHGIRD